MTQQTLTALCRTLEPLSTLSDSFVDVLAQSVQERWVFSGDVIFDQRVAADQTLYLLNGDARIHYASGDVADYKGRNCQLPLLPNLSQSQVVSILALSDCRLMSISSDRLDQLLSWSQITDYLQTVIAYRQDLDEDAEWMMTILRSNLFHKVPPTNAGRIFDRLKPLSVSDGDVILRQGELGDGCYFIKEGQAEVLQRNQEGKSVHLANIGLGRCFGEDALVNETVRNATIVMRSSGTLMRLEKQDFLELLRMPPVLECHWQTPSNDILIDVRTPAEYAQGHLDGAVNLPLALLGLQARQLNNEQSYCIYCDTGQRSRAVVALLSEQGKNVSWFAGGLFAMPESERLKALTKQDFLLRDGEVIGVDKD